MLSHPNAAWFAAYSSGLVLLFFCRDRRTLAYGMLAAGVAIAFAAPWLALMISRHGIAPFVAASLSSSTGPTALELLATLQVTQEPLAPVLAAVALVGVIVCARRGKWWLPAWLLGACLLDTRYSGTFAMVPLALLVGVAAGALTPLVTGLKGMGMPKGSRLAIHGIAAWICVLAIAGALLPSAPLRALPDSDLAAMRWVAASTPADADFLVVAPAGVSAGSESEWFPVVANRRSLGTYQGLEWLRHAPGASPSRTGSIVSRPVEPGTSPAWKPGRATMASCSITCSCVRLEPRACVPPCRIQLNSHWPSGGPTCRSLCADGIDSWAPGPVTLPATHGLEDERSRHGVELPKARVGGGGIHQQRAAVTFRETGTRPDRNEDVVVIRIPLLAPRNQALRGAIRTPFDSIRCVNGTDSTVLGWRIRVLALC